LSDDASLTIYRIVQECLTNVARHSKANRVEVAVGVRPGGSLIIRIADNGVGLPENFRFGFGFLGMSERVRRLNGRLNVSNRRSGGTVIEVTMPVPSHEVAQAS
jgi:two-component system, NarL family, sensor histidine kinase UhpB